MEPVRFYFDFVSPYSWLALLEAADFAPRHGIRWDLRPVVYAKLLDATDLIGPAERPVKRRYTFHDASRCARRLGVTFTGPPAHPFRSLEALRCACLFRDEPGLLALCTGLADAAWGRGEDLTDITILQRVVREQGLPADDLAGRLAAPAVKTTLRDLTTAALDDGVFGVPSFVAGGALFWGHDRMDHLAEHIAGDLQADDSAAERALARPFGARRRGAPGGDNSP